MVLPICEFVFLGLNVFTSSLSLSLSLSPLSLSSSDGVFAISPEGSLRYWRGVSEDIPYRDLRLELGGERSHSLTKLEVSD